MVLWVVTPCCLVGGYQCVGPLVGLCYLVECVGSSGLTERFPCVFAFEETEADIPPWCRYTFMWHCVTDTCSCKWFTADSIPFPSNQKCKNCEGVMWISNWGIDGER